MPYEEVIQRVNVDKNSKPPYRFKPFSTALIEYLEKKNKERDPKK